MGLRKDNLILKFKAKKVVWEFLKEGCAEKNKPQNSDKNKLVFSEDVTFHKFAILNQHKFSF
jgi:hypothetical protein